MKALAARPRRRLALVALGLALFAPLAIVLFARTPDVLEVPLADDSTDRPAAAIEVVTAEGSPADASVPLWMRGALDPASADRIQLLIATYGTAPRIEAADLRVNGCVFRVLQPFTASDGMFLELTRTAPCAAEDPEPAVLHLRVDQGGRLGLWTWQMLADGKGAPALTMTAPGTGSPTTSVVRGRMLATRARSGPDRWELLTWLWGEDARPLVTSVALVAIAAVLAGVLLVGAGGRPRVSTAAGAALLAFGMGATWAVIIPPLQGADEPDHLLSYGEVVGAADLPAQLETLARRTHFERIRFRAHEHFRAADRERPFPVPWTGDVHAEQMARRSPVTLHLWKMAHAAGLDGVPLPSLLLMLRLLGVLCFAAAAGVTAALVLAAAPGASLWPMLGLAIIPSLSYFAAMVSDWALVAAWSVLLAGGVIVVIRDGPRSSWAGLALGVGLALLVGTSISALPLIPLVAAVIAGRAVLGSTAEAPGSAAAVFWAGLTLGGIAGLVVVRDLFVAGYHRYDAASGDAAWLMAAVNRGVGVLAAHPWALLIAAPVLGAAEPLITRMRRGRPAVGIAGGRLATGGAIVLAVGAAGILVASALYAFPALATLQSETFAGPRAYISAVVRTIATIGRLTAFDHLTFTSFWSGFGWIDTILPAPLLALIAASSVAAFGATVAGYVGRRSARPLGWLLVVLAGGLASAVAYAAAGFLLRRNMHGRYLLGLYVPLIAAVWHGAAPQADDVLSRRVRWGLAGGAVLLHAFALAFVVSRYL